MYSEGRKILIITSILSCILFVTCLFVVLSTLWLFKIMMFDITAQNTLGVEQVSLAVHNHPWWAMLGMTALLVGVYLAYLAEKAEARRFEHWTLTKQSNIQR